MTGSFTEKRINLTFQLGKGSFGGSGFNTITHKGLRCLVVVDNAALATPGAIANIRVYGLTLSEMNELSVAGLLWNNRENTVKVEAGDDTRMTTVFNGQVLEAYPEFSEAPNTAFVVIAGPNSTVQMKPVDPVSFQGSVSGETALQKIMQSAGYTVENNGVSAQLSNPYFPGTAFEQAVRCTKAMDCFGYLDTINKKLVIWPKNGGGPGDPTEISPDNGMIGYPEFQKNQVKVRTYFNPDIKQMGKVKIKSGFTAADGVWNISRITYMLSAQLPDGPWEMTLTCYVEQPSGASTPSEGASTNL